MDMDRYDISILDDYKRTTGLKICLGGKLTS